MTVQPVLSPLLTMQPVLSPLLTMQPVLSPLLTMQPVLSPLLTIQPMFSPLLMVHPFLYACLFRMGDPCVTWQWYIEPFGSLILPVTSPIALHVSKASHLYEFF